MQLNDAELLVWAKAYCRVTWNWIGLIVAIVFFGLTLAPLIGWDKLVPLWAQVQADGAPFSPFLTLVVLDWPALARQPWHWCYLPSWALTFWLFFAVDKVSKEIKEGGDAVSRLPVLRLYMWASNFRFVLTNIGLLISLIYVWRAVDAWPQVVTFFQNLFGGLTQ